MYFHYSVNSYILPVLSGSDRRGECTMKIYECHNAPSARRVRIFLAEKSLDIPLIEVDIIKGENLLPEYMAINPRSLRPLLELDDGSYIDETVTICRYFELIQPTALLMVRTSCCGYLYCRAYCSFYTGKTRAYRLNKGIPHVKVNPSHHHYIDTVVPKLGYFAVPGLETTEGDIIQDSTDIILYLEERHPDLDIARAA
jgi:glutathione S-transferase